MSRSREEDRKNGGKKGGSNGNYSVSWDSGRQPIPGVRGLPLDVSEEEERLLRCKSGARGPSSKKTKEFPPREPFQILFFGHVDHRSPHVVALRMCMLPGTTLHATALGFGATGMSAAPISAIMVILSISDVLLAKTALMEGDA